LPRSENGLVTIVSHFYPNTCTKSRGAKSRSRCSACIPAQ
jgi:hypothetical protein